MLEAQGPRCAICRGDDPGRGYNWNVDHDHATREVRGLLCVRCNTMLAYAGDKPEALLAAVAYLASPPARSVLGAAPA